MLVGKHYIGLRKRSKTLTLRVKDLKFSRKIKRFNNADPH